MTITIDIHGYYHITTNGFYHINNITIKTMDSII
jgi:hypothetical protein